MVSKRYAFPLSSYCVIFIIVGKYVIIIGQQLKAYIWCTATETPAVNSEFCMQRFNPFRQITRYINSVCSR